MSSKSREIDQTTPLPDVDADKAVRVGPLDTIAAVRAELSRLYRAARRYHGPVIDAAAATKLAYILGVISRSLESAELERRIEELERKQGKE